jgi:hypothetical protein
MMYTSRALLDRAAALGSLRSVAVRLGVSEGALLSAKGRGHLSPELVLMLCDLLGLDPGPWVVARIRASVVERWPAFVWSGGVGRAEAGASLQGVLAGWGAGGGNPQSLPFNGAPKALQARG